MIKLQLEYILHGQRVYQRQNQLATREFDIVQYFENNTSQVVFELSRHKQETMNVQFQENMQEPMHRLESVMENVQQIMRNTQKAVRDQPSSECRLAFEDNGLIAFVPPETQLGDLICQFQKSNVLCILRKDARFRQENVWKLVGRATNYLPSSSSTPFNICEREMVFDEGSSPFIYNLEAGFRLDFSTFCKLTSTSATPDLENGR
jgi:hypothetical protein